MATRVFRTIILSFLSCVELELLWHWEYQNSPEAQNTKQETFPIHYVSNGHKKEPDGKVLKELEDLPYHKHFLVSPHSPGGGGLALLWHSDLEVDIITSNHNFIDTKITYKEACFFSTFVYGAPDVNKR